MPSQNNPTCVSCPSAQRLPRGGDSGRCRHRRRPDLDVVGSIDGDGRHATIGLENKWGDGGVQYFYGDDHYPYYRPIESGLASLFGPATTLYLPITLRNRPPLYSHARCRHARMLSPSAPPLRG